MTIPRETSKELIVTVENDSITVAMSPPVLDAVIVSGVSPQANADTMLVSGYDPISTNLFVRTVDGREFVVYNAGEDTGGPGAPQQITWGAGNPVSAGIAGSVYVNTANNSIWAWT